MVERILTKPGYKILGGLLIIVLLYVTNKMDKDYIQKIKHNSNIVVECNIKGKGLIEIDKSKIVDILDDGTFIFTNGYAKSCKIYK